jgi:hypothetical protein
MEILCVEAMSISKTGGVSARTGPLDLGPLDRNGPVTQGEGNGNG